MLRVRPKAMTVAVIVAGLLPIMFGDRYRLGGHAADRGADGRRHDYRAVAFDAGDSGRLSADAAAARTASTRLCLLEEATCTGLTGSWKPLRRGISTVTRGIP